MGGAAVAGQAEFADLVVLTHPANPDRILACSHYGELFASHDAGDSWIQLGREFAETRALTWTPN